MSDALGPRYPATLAVAYAPFVAIVSRSGSYARGRNATLPPRFFDGSEAQDYDPPAMVMRLRCSMTLMVVVTLSAGCNGSSVFLCQDNDQCSGPEGAGQCQPTGYCSFPDGQCDSGQRYGDHAGGSLANTCVDPAESATASDSGPTSDTPSPPVTNPLPSSTGTDGTTLALEDSAGPTGPDSAEDTSTTTELATSTTGPVLDCIVDDFDDEQLHDRWCEINMSGAEVSEHSGQLWFDIIPAQWGPGTFTDIRHCDTFPFPGSRLTVEVAQAPTLSSVTEVFLEVGTEEDGLGFGVYNGDFNVFTLESSNYATVLSQPYVADEHRFWRISATERSLIAEYSPDGNSWLMGYEQTFDTTVDPQIRIGVWASGPPPVFDSAVIESVELCTEL